MEILEKKFFNFLDKNQGVVNAAALFAGCAREIKEHPQRLMPPYTSGYDPALEYKWFSQLPQGSFLGELENIFFYLKWYLLLPPERRTVPELNEAYAELRGALTERLDTLIEGWSKYRLVQWGLGLLLFRVVGSPAYLRLSKVIFKDQNLARQISAFFTTKAKSFEILWREGTALLYKLWQQCDLPEIKAQPQIETMMRALEPKILFPSYIIPVKWGIVKWGIPAKFPALICGNGHIWQLSRRIHQLLDDRRIHQLLDEAGRSPLTIKLKYPEDDFIGRELSMWLIDRVKYCPICKGLADEELPHRIYNALEFLEDSFFLRLPMLELKEGDASVWKIMAEVNEYEDKLSRNVGLLQELEQSDRLQVMP